MERSDCHDYVFYNWCKYLVDYVILHDEFPTLEDVKNHSTFNELPMVESGYNAIKSNFDAVFGQFSWPFVHDHVYDQCFKDEQLTDFVRRMLYHQILTMSKGSCLEYSVMAFCKLRELGYEPKLCAGSMFRAGRDAFVDVSAHFWVEVNQRILDIATIGNSFQHMDAVRAGVHNSPKYFHRYAYTDSVYVPGTIFFGKKHFALDNWINLCRVDISPKPMNSVWLAYGVCLADLDGNIDFQKYQQYIALGTTAKDLVCATMNRKVQRFNVDTHNEQEMFNVFLQTEKDQNIPEYCDKQGYKMELKVGFVYDNSTLMKDGLNNV